MTSRPPVSDPTNLLEQANALTEAGFHTEALGFYTGLCKADPQNTDSWIGLSVVLLRQQRLTECLEASSTALALDSSRPKPYLIAAAALVQMGRLEDALKAADAALGLAPNEIKALSSKSTILIRLGRFSEALPLVERVLSIDPNDWSARLNVGIIYSHMGQPQKALDAFDRILVAQPHHPEALINRSSVLIILERFEEALQATESALSVQPEASVAWLNRTAALLQLQRPREALVASEQLLKRAPFHIKGLLNKTLAFLALGDCLEALKTVGQVLKHDPDNIDALELSLQSLLGSSRYTDVITQAKAALHRYPEHPGLWVALARALVGMKRWKEAESCLDALLAFDPRSSEVQVLKAEILWGQGQWDAAWSWIEQAITADSGQAALWTARSALLLAKEHYAEAWAASEHSLELNPSHIQATINGIAALNGLHRFDEALTRAESLLDRGICHWQLYANQGGALAGLERWTEAQKAFEAANHLDATAFRAFRSRYQADGSPPDTWLPDLNPRTEYLAFVLNRLLDDCDWKNYETIITHAINLIQQNLDENKPAPLPPFKTTFLPFAPELIAAIAQSHGQCIASYMATARQHLALTTLKPTGSRLRVGYVSADFRNHPTAHLISGLFQLHDLQRFEIYVYSLGYSDGSIYYQQTQANAEHFIDLAGMSNAEAASRIKADGVQILLDLMGYTAGSRPEIFALQPAPIQVAYLGYPGSLGAPFIPYIIADRVVLPETIRPHFTEQPVYLPECYQITHRGQEISESATRRVDHGLPEIGFIFCSFNQFQKLEPVMFSVWMRILARVPESVLWLFGGENKTAPGNLRAQAMRFGITQDRLIFAKRLPKSRHLERHRLANLFLDTRLCNAHTGASDALWAGLPVLTCLGETFPARVAASLLKAVGLPELITHSLKDYEELAVRLATHPDELAALRHKLAEQRLRFPLFDTERFARHLECAYEMMWQRHQQGLPPAPLWVPALPSAVHESHE